MTGDVSSSRILFLCFVPARFFYNSFDVKGSLSLSLSPSLVCCCWSPCFPILEDEMDLVLLRAAAVRINLLDETAGAAEGLSRERERERESQERFYKEEEGSRAKDRRRLFSFYNSRWCGKLEEE